MIQGALLVLESSNMTFKGLTIKQNFPNQVASLTVLNSKNIRIFNSSFEDNYDDLKAITPF
jgi:polygalacturonase